MSALALVLAFCASLRAAPAPPAKRVLPGQDVEFKTQDGWTIHGKYLAAQPGKKTVVLLHGRGRRKEEWYFVARHLQADGNGFVAVDLRGHGDSATAPDGQQASWHQFKVTQQQNPFDDMRFDAQAAFDFLASEKIDEDHTGVVGDDVGGSVGLKYAAVHPKVGFVVMLSPGMNYQEVLTVNAMRAYKNRPILMIYSELDKKSSREAPILYNFARLSAGEQNASLVAVAGVHGNRLIVHPPTVKLIADWVNNPVKIEPPAASTGTAVGVSSGDAPGGQPPPTDENQ